MKSPNRKRSTSSRSKRPRSLLRSVMEMFGGEPSGPVHPRRKGMMLETLEARQLLIGTPYPVFADNYSQEGGQVDNDIVVTLNDTGDNLLVFVDGQNVLDVPKSDVSQLLVYGQEGNDRLTVDSTNGLVDLPQGILFDGGNGFDTVEFRDDSQIQRSSTSVHVGSTPGSGDYAISDGEVAQRVQYENVEPIIDSIPAFNLTISGIPGLASLLDASNAINYESSPAFGPAWGRVTIDSFEPIDFQNKFSLTIDAGAGDDTINLNNPNVPAGLAAITVTGGDPTASDTLIVNGTAGFDSVTIKPSGASSVGVTGVPTPVQADTIEHVIYQGQGGNDDLNVDTVGIDGTQTLSPGTTVDSGTVTFQDNNLTTWIAPPLAFQGLGSLGSLTLSDVGQFDNLIYRGTDLDDTFVVDAAGRVVLNSQVPVNTPSIINLTLAGLDGSDKFDVAATTPLTGIAIEGGGAANGDVLLVDEAAAPIFNAQFQVSPLFGNNLPDTGSIQELTGGLQLTYQGIETVQMFGTSDDDVEIRDDLGNNTWKLARGPAVFLEASQVQIDDRTPIVMEGFDAVRLYNDAGADRFVVAPDRLPNLPTLYQVTGLLSGGAFRDTLEIDGTGQSDAPVTLTNDAVTLGTSVSYSQMAQIVVNTGGGNDLLEVDASTGPVTTPVVFDGGDGNDTLRVTGSANFPFGSVDYAPGPAVNAGSLHYTDVAGAPAMQIDFANLEPVLDNTVATTLTVNGTGADNAISYANGPSGVFFGNNPTGLVKVDGFESIEFNNKTNLVVNGDAGDDVIDIANPAIPTGLTGRITVDAGTADAGDQLVVHAQPGVFDPMVYEPTEAGAGTVNYFNGNLRPVDFTGVAALTLVGQEADNDPFGIDGTAGDDQFEYHSGLTPDTGYVTGALDRGGAPFALVPTSFQGMNQSAVLIFNSFGQSGGTDSFVFNGTSAIDQVTVNAGGAAALTISNSVNGLSVANLQVNGIASATVQTHDGDDQVQVGGALGVDLHVDGGNPSASDTLNFTGDGSGDVSVDLAAGTVQETGFSPVSYFGIEQLNVDAGLNVANLSTSAGNDRLSVTPVGPLSATAQANGAAPAISLSNARVLNVDLRDGSDVLTVNGDQGDDQITATADHVATSGRLGINYSTANVEKLELNGLAGDDQFDLDNSSGLLDLVGGVTVDGGDGQDLVRLIGQTPVDSVTYRPGPQVNEGTVVHTTEVSTQTLNFRNLEPLIDLVVAGNVNVYGTNAANTITYAAGANSGSALVGLQTTGQVAVDSFETLEFANKAQLSILALDGADTIEIANDTIPDGLSVISVDGGNSSGDVVVVYGTAGNESITYSPSGPTSGSVNVSTLVSVNFANVEDVEIDGRNNFGDDDLDINTFAIDGTQVLTPGPTFDSGTVVFQTGGFATAAAPTVSFRHLGTAGSLTFSDSGRFDNLVYNGTDLDDSFSVDSSGTVILNSQLPVFTPSIVNLTLSGGDGDDTFKVNGDHNLPSIQVQGGDPSASDILNFVGSGVGNLVLDLALSFIQELIFGQVSYTGIETINADAAGMALNVAATDNDDTLVVTPYGNDAGTAQLNGVSPVVNYSNVAANTLNADLRGGEDRLVVNGTSQGDSFAIDETIATVDTGALGGAVVYANTEALAANGLEGNDLFLLTPGDAAISIDGGDPVGLTNSDSLFVLAGGNFTTFQAGPESDEGGVQVGATAPISYDHIESATISAADGVQVLGTSGDDDLTATGGELDSDVIVYSSNAVPLYLISPSTVILDGQAGDDDITVVPFSGVTPITVPIIVAGGLPSLDPLVDGDRLTVDGSDNGETIAVDLAAGSINVGAAAPISYGGIEHLAINAAGGTDTVALSGADRYEYTPGTAVDASFVQADAMPIAIRGLDSGENLAVTGTGISPQLTVNGTAGTDSVNVTGPGGLIQVNDRAAIAATNIFSLAMNGLEGDDSFAIFAPVSEFGGGISISAGASTADTVLIIGDSLNPLAAQFSLIPGLLGVSGGGIAGNVQMYDVEAVGLFAGNQAIALQTTGADDLLSITPQDATTGFAQANGISPLVQYVTTGPVNADLADGQDTLEFNGSPGSDTITAIPGTLTVAGRIPLNYNVASTESLVLNGSSGDDTFNVTAGPAPIFVDGGDPIGAVGDVLNITATGAVTATPGPQGDEGSFGIAGTAGVSYDHIEDANVDLAGFGLTANATNGDDDITVVGLGTNSFDLSINGGPAVTYTGASSLAINALAGDDDIDVEQGVAGFVVPISVDGGPSTTSGGDIITLTGLAGTDAFTYAPTDIGTGSAAIAGGTSVTFTTAEQMVINGLGGGDSLTVATPVGVNQETYTPGTASDAGTIASRVAGPGAALVPLAFSQLGAFGSVSFTSGGGREDLLELNGTNVSDNFTVNQIPDQIQILRPTGAFTTVALKTAGISVLDLRGLNGDDTFNLNATLPYAQTLVDGGEPSASDSLVLSGAAGAIVDDLAAQTVTGYGGTLSYLGVEHVTLNGTGGAVTLTINATSGPDDLAYTPTGGNAGTVTRSGQNVTTDFNFIAGSFTLDSLGGNDTVTVNGTSLGDTISVGRGATTTVGVNALKPVNLPAANVESLVVSAAAGNDTITVSGTGGTAFLNVLGGDSNSSSGAGDRLIVNSAAGTTTVSPGSTPDAGVVDAPAANPTDDVGFSGMEFLTVNGTGAGGDTLVMQGTQGNDTMAVQNLGGSNLVWVNDRAVVTFASFPIVTLSGRFGDDKINVTPTGLVGVTTVNAQGGDPTASDEVVVNGTSGGDNVTIGSLASDGATVTGLGGITINVSTTENLVYSGQGGDDTLNVITPAGNQLVRFETGAVADAGRILVSQGAAASLIPIAFQGVGINGLVSLSNTGGGRADSVDFIGTAADDVITVNSAGRIQAFDPAGGTNHARSLGLDTPGVAQVDLEGLDGDDVFNVPGNHPFTNLFGLAAIRVEGGNPSASDVLNFTGSGAGAVTVDLGAATVVEAGFGTVSYSSVETINALTTGATNPSININDTTGDDDMVVTVLNANQGSVVANNAAPTVNYFNTGGAPVNFPFAAGGEDTLRIVGNALSQTISANVTGAAAALAPPFVPVAFNLPARTAVVDDLNDGTANGQVSWTASLESLELFGLEGNDTFAVVSGAIPVFVDGGDPIGIVPGDQLNVIGAVGFMPGPESDEGGFMTAGGGAVSFDHIESLEVGGVAGCPFFLIGTEADDDITVIARDGSTTLGADGVQDFTASINAGPVITFIDQANLVIDGRAGDDDIVVRAPAPNEANWNVTIQVAGGTPSIGDPNEADRLVLETPGVTNVVYTPTGPDTGSLLMDVANNGVFDAATDSLITFGTFTAVCEPANVTYTSSPGGVELVEYDGENSSDRLTIAGTSTNDTTTINAGDGQRSGSFRSLQSPLFDFRHIGTAVVNPGSGGFDVVTINGTQGPDALTTPVANTIQLSGGVATQLGAGIDRLELNTLDGNDSITLGANLAVTGLYKVLDAGTGNDQVDLSGLPADPADPVVYGGDGDDTITGSVNADEIYGGVGNDIIVSLGGIDTVYGGDGDDTITGGTGNDNLFGGAGSDRFIWNNGDNSDVVEGDDGVDVQVINGAAAGDAFLLRTKTGDESRAFFERTNLIPFSIDMGKVEQVDMNTGDGADTVEVRDLYTTDVTDVNVNVGSDALADSVTVQGRTVADNVNLSYYSTQNAVNIAGLKYDVNVGALDPINDSDTLTFNANDGDDTVVAQDTLSNIFGSTFAQVNRLIINGGAGNDSLSGFGNLNGDAGADILTGGSFGQLITGGDGDDQLYGGGGDDTLNGNAGEDLFVPGSGNDTVDGGDVAGAIEWDTILVSGTSAGDIIDVNQTLPTSVTYRVNSNTQTDTLTLMGDGTRTVDELRVDAGAGADLIRVKIADAAVNSMATDAVYNALVTTVHGGTATGAGDRLVMIDDGAADLTLYRKGQDVTGGNVTIGPANAEPFESVFDGIERVQFLDAAGNPVNQDASGSSNSIGNPATRLVVFATDLNEYNDDRYTSTVLGTPTTTTLGGLVDPGAIINPFGDGMNIPGDQDWFKVQANVTGTLDFQAMFDEIATLSSGRPGLPGNGDLDIYVYDANGTLIAGNGPAWGGNDGSGANPELDVDGDTFAENERIRIPAVQGQTYYVQVIGRNVGGGNPTALTGTINSFTLNVINTPPAVPFDLELDDNPVNGTPNPPGQTDNSDTGRSQFDNHTYDKTPTIIFRLDDGLLLNDMPGNDTTDTPPDEIISIPFLPGVGPDGTQPTGAGYAIAIFDEGSTAPAAGNAGGTNVRQPLGFATQLESGLYTFTVPAGQALNDGSHFITARVLMIDPATPAQSGWGDRSLSLEIVVDTVAPPTYFGYVNLADTTQGLSASSDSGVDGYPATNVERVTNDTTPTVFGTAEADTIVRLYVETNGVPGLQSRESGSATPDLFIGLTTAVPTDGSNQFPGGNWELTSQLDLNNPNLGFVQDGVRKIYATGEDLAGNITADASADVLNLFLDTRGPQVTRVDVNARNNTYNVWDHKGKPDGTAGTLVPTPLVNSIVVSVQDLPARSNVDPNFLYEALFTPVSIDPGLYSLVGDHNGIIPIKTITFTSDAVSNGVIATGFVTITFFEPLPDDRYTLTLSDGITDRVGNHLDGEANTDEPHDSPSTLPSGDGVPGGDFVARFTVDSRPEIGNWVSGATYVDANGNFQFDPENPDFTNRDLQFKFQYPEVGPTTDEVYTTDNEFSGKFTKVGATSNDGFDRLGAYGLVGGVYRWLIDTNNNGVADLRVVDPKNINGLPVAGNFDNNAANGDEVGLFTGTTWWVDTNHDYMVDTQISTNLPKGYPIVGDFDGDGKDDLAVWSDDKFSFDLASNGFGTTDDSIAFGFLGVRERPVAADMDADGVDDIGLWVPDRAGQAPQESAEWYFLVSNFPTTQQKLDAKGTANLLDHPFTPVPFGKDLYALYGDEFSLPIVGNFDPPVTSGTGNSNSNTLDVDNDTFVAPIDALLVINYLNQNGSTPIAEAEVAGGSVRLDVNHDGYVAPIDALLVINYLNLLSAGEGEAAPTDSAVEAEPVAAAPQTPVAVAAATATSGDASGSGAVVAATTGANSTAHDQLFGQNANIVDEQTSDDLFGLLASANNEDQSDEAVDWLYGRLA